MVQKVRQCVYKLNTSFEFTAHIPMTKRTLNTAEPTMVPNPTALPVKVPTNEVKSSGAEPPADRLLGAQARHFWIISGYHLCQNCPALKS